MALKLFQESEQSKNSTLGEQIIAIRDELEKVDMELKTALLSINNAEVESLKKRKEELLNEFHNLDGVESISLHDKEAKEDDKQYPIAA